ncbi:putative alcohol dehydrogenase [Pyrenochaeta sp. DS3sAY3a]|nr:putative alcohol dehydrogenase [Pyrenochaeta sp. DS3sAY3a]
MTTQTALLVQKVGEPVSAVHDWPVPLPGSRQIQVKVAVAGLNPHDQKSRDLGFLINDNLPGIVGSDVVGVVTALGDDVKRFRVGERVVGQASIALGRNSKALQQYAILEEDYAAVVQDGFSEDEYATLPTNLLAGVIGFFDKDGLNLPAPWSKQESSPSLSKSSILIIGGGSNCGRFATQLAKLTNFGTIVVVGGSETELKGYGATHVVDRHGGHDAVLARIRAVVGDDLLYAFDAYNPPDSQHLAINALSSSKTGKLARLRWSGRNVSDADIHPKAAGFELKDVLGASDLKPEVAVPLWQHLPDYLAQGQIKPLKFVVEQGLDPEKVNKVLDAYRDGLPVVQTHFHL